MHTQHHQVWISELLFVFEVTVYVAELLSLDMKSLQRVLKNCSDIKVWGIIVITITTAKIFFKKNCRDDFFYTLVIFLS